MRRISAASKNAKLAELKATDLARFNVEAEKEFQLFLCKNITAYGPMDFSDATREVAFAVNVGLATAKKYLLKHTVRQAHFCITGLGQIDCRPHADRGRESELGSQEEPESRRARR